jgi:hypothetical protein
VHSLERVVARVRELLSEDPFPPRIVQTLAALTAFAAHLQTSQLTGVNFRRADLTDVELAISES